VIRLSLFLCLALSGCAVQRVESAPPPLSGVSYAWVTFDGAGERALGAAGLADRARGRALTVDDPARIASISKLVVGLGVMRLVEQGRLDLDRDISDYLGWRLRNPAFAKTPITLRLLLSHRSGLRDEVDYAIPLGKTVAAAVSDPKAFDPEHAPGTYFRYSNLNLPVVASVMEAVTGERFDRLMARLVLTPLGLDACFNWTTCSDAAMARAVVLYDGAGAVLRDDLGGRRPDCPVVPAVDGSCDLQSYRLGSNGALFSPQGGLRISARDFATVGRLLLNRGKHDGRVFLRPESVDALLAPHWRYDGANGATEGGFYCAYGLAVQKLPVRDVTGCRDDLLGDGRAVSGHAGDAYGVRSGLWIDPERGEGIAYLSANNGEDPPGGRSAYRAIEEWLAARLSAPR
jgi:CubicO group peptidase (beta-lactamase class C family)